MFCDITNSTPLAARVGAEAMHGLFNRFFEIALAEVHRHEGTINQFLGDGFMALFGAPIAHEDHARRALLAATAIQQSLRDVAGSDDLLHELQLRMGLNTGRIVVGKIGDNLRMDYTAIGDTTNLAARLQSIADPDTIRVSESTYRAALDDFEFQPLGKFRLKGIADRVQIYEPLRGGPIGNSDTADRSAPVHSAFFAKTESVENTVSYTPPHLAEKILTSRSALEGERKLITVMFCNIANSTPLAARVGAEAMHGLLNRFFEIALAEVHRYEGTINQFLGDGFMALFGAPIAHEDHARRALLAATAIQQHFRDIDGSDDPLRVLQLRMGLNTGTVVVGKIGDNLRMDYTAIGDTTNLAARLQGIADPDTIRVSESTHRAAKTHFNFKDLGRHALKGIDSSVKVFEPLTDRLEAGRGVHGKRDGVGSVLVGRNSELVNLVRSLGALGNGQGEIVLLRGEPGTGKSRLLAEAKRHDAAGRVLWLEGPAISFGRTLSYWPFIEILSTVFGITEGDAEAEALRKLETGVRALFDTRAPEIVPYLATVMSLELSGDYKQRVEFLDAQAMKRQLFLAMRQLFERLAEQQPVLVVLEDWHWVDQSSVALFEHLVPLTQRRPLSFWFTTRGEPAQPATQVKAAVAATPELRFEEIIIAPLLQEHSRTLIINLIGTKGVPEPVLRQIEHRTEGNPFFMEEVVRTLIANETLVRDAQIGGWRLSVPVADVAIPDTVQGVIAARIDRLEEAVKGVLKLASVIGRSFFLRILKAINQAADNVEEGLNRLEDAELIRLRQQIPEIEYIFNHALVQEAAYDSILSERRRAIHRSVAQAIEQVFSDRRDEFVSLLAYHYARAEDWEHAYAALLSAGDQAGRIAADAEALEHYRQAEAIFMKVASRELTPLQRATMDRKIGQAYYGIGDYEQAVSHFSSALAHLGVRYPSTPGGVFRKIPIYLASHFLHLFGRVPDAVARRRLDAAVGREIATICQSLVWLDYFADENRMTLDTLIELDAGERSGDALGRSRGLAGLGLVFMFLGRHKLAHRHMLMASSIAHYAGAPAAIAASQFYSAWLALTKGCLAEADRTFEQATSAYQAIGDLRGRCGAEAMRIWALLHRAEYAPALALAEDVVRVGQGAGDPHALSYGLNSLGVLRVTVGPLDEAERNLEQDRAVTLQISSHRMHASACGLLGKCYLRQGRLRCASQILHETMHLIEVKKMNDLFMADGVMSFAELSLIELASLTGASRRIALRRAKSACKAALRLSRKAAVAWRPEALRLHGTLAWMSGSMWQAIARWQNSIAAATAMSMPVERARTLLEMGTRLGDISLVDEARGIFEITNAKVDLAFAQHILARMVTSTDTNAGGALPLYDQAIAGLSEVKAEYRLGLAYQERAELLIKAGRNAEAWSDLARARQILEAAPIEDAITAIAA